MSDPFMPFMTAQYLSLQLLRFLALALPPGAGRRVGEALGDAAAWSSPARCRLGVENLRLAFPDMPEAEAEEIVRRVFRHFTCGLMDVARAPRLLRTETIDRHLIIRTRDAFEAALASPRSVIWVGAHLGVWELFSYYLHLRGVRVTTVYRPVRNPLIDRLVNRHRAALGQHTVERRGALRSLVRVLRRGDSHVAMLVDQHVRKDDAVWVPFFGRPAATTPGPAVLSLITGAPIVLWGCRRAAGDYRFEAWCDPPFVADSTGDREADILRVTARISRRIEDFVRETPDQWLWLHRRWRTPPSPPPGKEAPHVEPAGRTA